MMDGSKYRNGILSIFDGLSTNMEYKIFGIPMKGIARGALISGLQNMTEEQAKIYIVNVQKTAREILRLPLRTH